MAKYTYAHGMHAYYAAPWVKDLPEDEQKYYGGAEMIIDEVIDPETAIVVRPLNSDGTWTVHPDTLSEPFGAACEH